MSNLVERAAQASGGYTDEEWVKLVASTDPFDRCTVTNARSVAENILAMSVIREALETHEMVTAMEGWGVPRGNPTAPSKGPDQRL